MPCAARSTSSRAARIVPCGVVRADNAASAAPKATRPDVVEIRRSSPVRRIAVALSHRAASLAPRGSSTSRYGARAGAARARASASKPSIRRAAPAAAAAAPAGIRPTSSEPTTSTPRVAASCFDPLDDLVQGSRLVVLDVHAHLHEPGSRQVQPERAHAGEAAARLAHDRGDLPRGLESSPRRLTLNAISGRRAPTMTPPARSSSRAGPKSGRELARVDPPLELRRARRARKNAGPAPGAELAVEEDRQAELAADPLRESQRAVPRPLAVFRSERDDRHDVGGADSRVRALVLGAGRSARARTAIPARSASTSDVVVADEREDRAVVIGVRVDVEQARAASRAPRRAPRSSPASRPSEKFGTDSSGSSTRVLYEAVKAYYDRARAGVRRLVARHRALRRPRPARAGTRSSTRSRRTFARSRPRGRSTSPAAPAS